MVAWTFTTTTFFLNSFFRNSDEVRKRCRKYTQQHHRLAAPFKLRQHLHHARVGGGAVVQHAPLVQDEGVVPVGEGADPVDEARRRLQGHRRVGLSTLGRDGELAAPT